MKKLAFALALIVAAGALFAFGCGKKQSERSLYEIECAYENGVLEGSMDFTFYNDFPTAVKELKFNLFPNAYREGAKYPAVSASAAAGAYYAGKSYGNIEISAVRDEEGETEFSVGGAAENVLTVKEGSFPRRAVLPLRRFHGETRKNRSPPRHCEKRGQSRQFLSRSLRVGRRILRMRVLLFGRSVLFGLRRL